MSGGLDRQAEHNQKRKSDTSGYGRGLARGVVQTVGVDDAVYLFPGVRCSPCMQEAPDDRVLWAAGDEKRLG